MRSTGLFSAMLIYFFVLGVSVGPFPHTQDSTQSYGVVRQTNQGKVELTLCPIDNRGSNATNTFKQ